MYNSIKILIRNLYRNSLYTWINIIGLAVSLAAAISILIWVQDEWNYNKAYKHADDIYMLYSAFTVDGQERYTDNFPMIYARTIESEFGEARLATAVSKYSRGLNYIEYDGNNFFRDDFIIADSCFFHVFDMTFVEGDERTALTNPNNMVITDELASVIFGSEKALGKRVKGSNTQEYTISGVVRKPPQNSLIQFSSITSPREIYAMDGWNRNHFQVFVMFRPDADLKNAAVKLAQVLNKHTLSNNNRITPHPLTKQHLYSPDGRETGMKNVRLFTIVALALLAIASINYVNLVTARAGKRAKEVALRKILGANRRQLFLQLIGEAVVMLLLAIALATVFLFVLEPHYCALTGKQLIFGSNLILIYVLCFVFILLFSGIYPAILTSSFKPLEIFRSKILDARKRFSLRSVLVVLQFSCSAIFILVIIVMNSQQHYMHTKDLGYDRENTITIKAGSSRNIYKHIETFMFELGQQSSIVEVAGAWQNIVDASPHSNITWDGMYEDSGLGIAPFFVTRSFVEMFDLELVQGSGFSGTTADSTSFIVNETAVKKMGLENPIGTNVYDRPFGVEGKIVGVAKDFHFMHMRNPIFPAYILLADPEFISVVYIKVAKGKSTEAIASAEQTWKKFEPTYPFEYEFMDEHFDMMYRDDTRARNLFNAFAFIAVLVACLGLFGLVTYTAEAKTKEIGIRKTLGASVRSIVSMLAKDFAGLAGIAVIIGMPIAYYIMDKMLQSYTYRISITWWMIVAAILAVLALVVLTVSAQAVKAASTNPVKAIKTE